MEPLTVAKQSSNIDTLDLPRARHARETQLARVDVRLVEMVFGYAENGVCVFRVGH
jgi:hypothetical protein